MRASNFVGIFQRGIKVHNYISFFKAVSDKCIIDKADVAVLTDHSNWIISCEDGLSFSFDWESLWAEFWVHATVENWARVSWEDQTIWWDLKINYAFIFVILVDNFSECAQEVIFNNFRVVSCSKDPCIVGSNYIKTTIIEEEEGVAASWGNFRDVCVMFM